ncbi:HIT family protein [Aquirufa nivalisilvae]|uniref:Putative HIT-like protein n=1 Tax=Aquirufa nivalisilvae TaxID=2516557 RepID=A0A2S2DXN5_9BACT|nr:HIT family protein [Aquirufa nivalisilvae]AWL10116.1 putative HIT-like protein [Aquirufa nivalisilvae]MCZ2480743.1 HIT family protein [Aquirufa nivalisilvae]TBH71078.1 HIT family protein [Aquirufa nivalisilvae]
MSTIFSKIISGEIPCHKIAENEQFLAFLDVMPLVEGHVLVVPKQEIDYIFDIEPETLGNLMKFAQSVAPAIRKAIPCKRIGVAVIGLEVPHAHVHLVPMNTANDLNFTQAKLQVSQESLAKTAELIRSFL